MKDTTCLALRKANYSKLRLTESKNDMVMTNSKDPQLSIAK